MRFLITALTFVLFTTHAFALSISDLSNTEASGGLKAAWIQGATKALGQLSALVCNAKSIRRRVFNDGKGRSYNS